jgi:hypothetical protein
VRLSAVLQFYTFPLGKIDPAHRVLDHHIIDSGIAGTVPARGLKVPHQPRFADPISQIGDDHQQQQSHGFLPCNRVGWFSSSMIR